MVGILVLRYVHCARVVDALGGVGVRWGDGGGSNIGRY